MSSGNIFCSYTGVLMYMKKQLGCFKLMSYHLSSVDCSTFKAGHIKKIFDLRFDITKFGISPSARSCTWTRAIPSTQAGQ